MRDWFEVCFPVSLPLNDAEGECAGHAEHHEDDQMVLQEQYAWVEEAARGTDALGHLEQGERGAGVVRVHAAEDGVDLRVVAGVSKS